MKKKVFLMFSPHVPNSPLTACGAGSMRLEVLMLCSLSTPVPNHSSVLDTWVSVFVRGTLWTINAHVIKLFTHVLPCKYPKKERKIWCFITAAFYLCMVNIRVATPWLPPFLSCPSITRRVLRGLLGEKKRDVAKIKSDKNLPAISLHLDMPCCTSDTLSV